MMDKEGRTGTFADHAQCDGLALVVARRELASSFGGHVSTSSVELVDERVGWLSGRVANEE